MIGISSAQEIRVQRMHLPAANGVARRRQRLAKHLAAEHARTAQIAALAAKDPLLDPLELEQVQEIGEDRAHCSYCFSWRFKRAIKLDVSQRLPPIPTTSA